MMKLIGNIIIAATLSLVFTSCDKDDGPDDQRQWEGNVLIVNEGPFQTGSGTVDAYNSATGEVQSDLFGSANGRPVGNILQSALVFKDNVYLVVNKANKIEVADLNTFVSKGSIEGLTLPRYMVLATETKGYVSCWDNTVRVLDLATLEVTGSIPAGTGPDEMAIAANRLFVLNSGGFGVDSTVTVVDLATDGVIQTLVVGDRPAGITGDLSGRLYILCSGIGWNGFPAEDDSPARLVRIDPSSLEIAELFSFNDPAIHPDQLVSNADGSVLYFNMPEGIYNYNVEQDELSDGPFITSQVMFYGLGFSRSEGVIYATDPLDYVQDGWVYRFWADNGMPIDSVRAGVIPSSFWFLDSK